VTITIVEDEFRQIRRKTNVLSGNIEIYQDSNFEHTYVSIESRRPQNISLTITKKRTERDMQLNVLVFAPIAMIIIMAVAMFAYFGLHGKRKERDPKSRD
jgi:hypothetical protein